MLKYCHMTEPQIVGLRIKALRERKKWGYSELARRVGTRHQHIIQIEAGKIIVGYVLLARIAAQLEVSTDYLIGQANIHDLSGTEDLAAQVAHEHAPSLTPAEIISWLELLNQSEKDFRDSVLNMVAQAVGNKQETAKEGGGRVTETPAEYNSHPPEKDEGSAEA